MGINVVIKQTIGSGEDNQAGVLDLVLGTVQNLYKIERDRRIQCPVVDDIMRVKYLTNHYLLALQ